MDFRAAIIASVWFSVTIMSSVYMLVFGNKIGDAMGIFLPIGLLILVAIIVTFGVASIEQEKKNLISKAIV